MSDSSRYAAVIERRCEVCNAVMELQPVCGSFEYVCPKATEHTRQWASTNTTDEPPILATAAKHDGDRVVRRHRHPCGSRRDLRRRPMTIDSATVEQLRDELARLLGWTRVTGDAQWLNINDGRMCDLPHVIPLTLDFVAAAEERGRWIAVTFWAGHDPPRWTAQSHAGTCEGPDELTARLRLVVKVRQAQEQL